MTEQEDRYRPRSPRPIRRDNYKRSGYYRIPSTGPVLPRLRPENLVSAIGYTVGLRQDEENDNEA